MNILANNPTEAASYVKSLEGGDLEIHLGVTTEIAGDVVEIPRPVEMHNETEQD